MEDINLGVTRMYKFYQFVSVTLIATTLTFFSWANDEWVEVKQENAEQITRLCPLGDHEHVYLYDFIRDMLKDEDTQRSDVLGVLRIEEENKLSGEIYKPYSAGAYESFVSYIFNALCKADETCVAVSLFDRAGLLYATGLGNCNIELEALDRIHIEDEVYDGYTTGSRQWPLVMPFDQKIEGFTWNPFAKFVSILYPIFLDEENDMAVLYKTEKANKLIGFIILVRQEG